MSLPSKDPLAVEPYFIIWCDEDNTNDGTADDGGELQGATISSVVWSIPSGITQDSSNQSSVTVAGVTYAADTVCTTWMSAGSDGKSYDLECKVVTSDSRTLYKTITIPVRSH